LKQLKNFRKKPGKPKWEVEEVDHSNVKKQIVDKFEAGLRSAFKEIDKKKRSTAIAEIEVSM
jgi:polyribonucleotide nucleotidyltransferase